MTMQGRPAKMTGTTYQSKCACGAIYITCNDNVDGKLSEVLVRIGKAGGCASANKETVGKILSIALRSGAAPGDLITALEGVSCHLTTPHVGSCISNIAQKMKEHEEVKKENAQTGAEA